METKWKDAYKRQRLSWGTTSHKIMTALVLSGGEYPVGSLNLTMTDPGQVSRKISELTDQGWIEKKTNESVGEKVLRLKLFQKRRDEYMEYLFEGGAFYEITELSKGGKTVSRRKLELAELLMFFLTGKKVIVTPDKIPIVTKENIGREMFPFFMCSTLAKKLSGETVRAKLATRYNGMLITEAGVYAVYNLRHRKLEWIALNESAARETIDVLRNSYLPWSAEYLKFKYTGERRDGVNRFIEGGAILYSHNYMNFSHYFDDREVNGSTFLKRHGSPLRRLADTYTNVYCLPMTVDGMMLTNMMTVENWHYKLTILFVDQSWINPDSERAAVDTDATAPDGTKLLLFTDCDLKRFYRVMKIAEIENRRGQGTHYHVICFDFQEELIKGHIPGNVTMEAVSVNETIEEFLKNERTNK